MWSSKFSRRKPASGKSSKKRSRAARSGLSLGQRRYGIEPLEQRTLLSVLSPVQVRHAYGVDQINYGSVAANGAGQTIAIIDPGDDSAIVSDLASFDSLYGLAAPPSFTVVGETGGARPVYNSVAISTATESSTTVTITTSSAHNLSIGQSVVIAGVTNSGYNGTFSITAVPSATTFQYTTGSGLTSSSGGTATPQNPAETGETALDVEWSHAMAPAAGILLVEMNEFGGSNIGDAVHTAITEGASVVSMSFGAQEYSGENSAATTYSSSITSAAESGNTVTITTSAPITYASGCQVTITGVGVGGYNGTFTINSVTSTSPGNTFTYTDSNTGLANSSGGTAAAAADDDALFSGHSGVAFVASSGDIGQPPEYPSVSPDVLAVGATNLNLNGDNTYNAEIGWSNPPAITSATESGSTVTITAATATGLFAGDLTTISGVTVAGYNGVYTVTKVLSPTSFQYTDAATGLAGSSGGTVYGNTFTDGNSGGSGGGKSNPGTGDESQPAYQQGTVTKVTQTSTARTTPDVSFVGGTATPVAAYDTFSGGVYATGGTSLSAPCWAGLIADVDQGLALQSKPVLNTNTTFTLQTALYDTPLVDFHDVTTGYNGFNAGAGYDLVTGIGTPVANLLIPDLAGTSIDYPVPTTGSPHHLTLERVGTGATATVELFDNGTMVGSAPAATFSEADIIDPDSSNDSLTVDYVSDGFFAGDVNFDHTGASGYDTVAVNAPNGPSNTTVLSESPYTAGDSTITVDGAAQTMNLQNVSEVDINDGSGGDAVTINGGGYDNSGLQQVKVLGGAGNDTLKVDSSNGLAAFPNGILFDGGAGFNSLQLTQTVNAGLPNNGTQTSDAYSVGPYPGEGSDVIAGPSGTQTVEFQNLTPVTDNVTAATFTVNATPASNAINYSQGPGGGIFTGNTGLVTIDNQESIEFNNKTSLIINGLAGSDTINLNNPTTPAGLTGITVNGGDPTAGDMLIANGTASADTITYTPTAVDGGKITGAGPVSITFNTIEQLLLNGQGGGDTLTFMAVGGGDTITSTPGAATDAGTLQDNNLLALNYENLGAAPPIAIQDTAVGNNTLVVNGTAADDAFVVAATTGDVAVNKQVQLAPTNLQTLTINGLDGDNTYSISAQTAYTTINVNGSGLSDPDVVTLNGNGTALTANLGTATPSVTGGGLGTVDVAGVGTVILNAGAGAVAVSGTTAANAFSVTPTGANSAAVQVTGSFPLLNATTTSTLTIDDTNPPDGDTVTVNGTGGNDTIAVVRNAATDTVQVGGLKTISITSAAASGVIVATGLGVDTVNVSGAGGPVLTVAGGQSPASDTLNVSNTATGTTVVTPGATNDAGTVTNSDGTINFSGLKQVSVTAAAATDQLTVNGTGGNDVIAAARVSGQNQVSVNSQAVVSFTGFNALNLNGGAGNDVFNVSPVGLVMVGTTPAVNVAGAAGASGQVTVNDSGGAAVSFTPTGAAAGSVAISGSVPVVKISNVPALTINGQGGNAALTFMAVGGGDTITSTPGATIDSGALQDNNLLALNYQNLGTTGAVLVQDSGAGTLVANGTSADDKFQVTDLTGPTRGQVAVNNQLPLQTNALITGLTLNGLAGDNTYTLTATSTNPLPYTTIIINGSGLPDPDVVNLTGDGTDAAKVTLAGNNTGTVTGGGLVPSGDFINISGVGTVNLNNTAGSGAAVTVADAASNNTLVVTPTGAQSATSQISGQAPVVNTTSAGPLAVTLAGSDQLVVNGSQYDDTITANGATSLVQVSNTPQGTLQQISYSGAASLTVNGNDGNDTFNVTPGAIPILVDGGNPVGVQPGDVLNLNAGGGGVTFFPGPTTDSGGFLVGSSASVSFVHIESIGAILNPGNVTIDGTNGDDDITVIARDNSYAPGTPGLDGVQDFTASVNAGPQVLYVNATSLTVNSLSGDDNIVLQTPAPNDAAWGEPVTINGGAPQTLGGPLGDTFSLETPDGTTAAQAISYQPTGPNSGMLHYDLTVNPIALNGIEQVFYNGGAKGDALTFIGSGNNNDTITSTPGATTDSGTLQDNSLLALNYQNLGPTPAIAVQDTGSGNSLVVDGIGSNDTYAVSTGGSGFLDQVKLDKQVPLQTNANINSLTLNGSGLPDPNIVNLTGPTGAITVNLADSTIPTNTTITGYGATVTLINVDVCNMNAGGTERLTVMGTAEDDNITYTPTGANAGTFQNAGLNTVFNFTNVTGPANPFSIDGGGGVADQVTVDGTTNRDLFEIDQGNRTVQVLAYDTTQLKTVNLDNGIETVTALGLPGEDTFQVIPSASVSVNNLVVNVDGGDPTSGNALVIGSAFTTVGQMPSLSSADFVVVSRSAEPNSGTVRVYANSGNTQFPDINYQNVATVAPQVYVAGPNGLNPNLLVMGPDLNEPNDSQGTATFLGSGATLQVQNATIFPAGSEYPGAPADQDYYQVVAQTTGTLDFQVYFHLYTNLLPGNGALNLQAFDVAGDLIAQATTPGPTSTFGLVGTTADARVRIPVVAGQSYFLRVYGATPNVINGYNMTVINTAPPTPFDLELSRSALAITITNAGSGYTSAPTVTFSGGGAGATQATGIADISGGAVIGVTLTSNGSGYTSAPNVTFTGGGFLTAATATASLTDVGDLPPNAPNDDTGRSQFDNVTNDNVPTIYIQLADGVLLNDLPGNGTTDSPPAGVISIPYSSNESTAGFRVAIFDGNNSQTPVGYATPVGSGFPGLYQYTFTAALADGLHQISAAVQMIDPATPTETGFGALSTSLGIIVDTVPPPVFFGSSVNGYDGLAPASDSGVQGYSATNVDRVTNDTTPTLWGTAEADAIVRVYAVGNAGNVFLGQTTATPTDGTNADPDGQWSLTTTVDLNNPAFFPHDGTRTLLVTAEDLAGNVSAASSMLIFIDTSGPQISNVNLDDVNGIPNTSYNLFAEKTANAASTPTPLVYGLTISVTDNPDRDTANFGEYLALLIPTPVVTITGGGSGYSSAPIVTFSGGGATTQATGIAMIANGVVTGVEITSSGSGYTSAPDVAFSGGGFTTPASATAVLQSPGNIVLQGDAGGIIAISNVTITDTYPLTNGAPATATVTLTFATPLPDDRYTLTIKDTALMDPAGNLLDGESNASQPNGAPMFPSGNGVPGGDFVARFTVDSRPEIGVWSNGVAYLDANGNFTWDPTNADASNRDLSFQFALATDKVFTYTPVAGGFDTLAAYGMYGGSYRWLFTNTSGQVDSVQTQSSLAGVTFDQSESPSPIANFTFTPNGLPVAGNFSDTPGGGDDLGLFTGGTSPVWELNLDNPNGSSPIAVKSLITGYPIVGDFDGDGHVDLGTYRADTDTFWFQLWDSTTGKYDIVQHFSIGPGSPSNPSGSSAGFNPGVRAIPVAADMDQDGITDVGLFVPDQSGGTAMQTGEWFWWLSNDLAGTARITGEVNTLAHPFTPLGVPGGYDLYADFGSYYAMPVVGNFDPSVGTSATAQPGPAQVSLLGTPGNDNFSFSPGSTADTWIISLDGATQTVVGSSIQVSFNGLGGTDVAVVNGSGSGQQAVLRPGSADISGAGYSVHVVAKSITVNAGSGGSGKVTFSGVAGKTDYFTATQTSATQCDSSTGKWTNYYDCAKNFTAIVANSTPGEQDRASLYGTPTSVFNAYATYAQFGCIRVNSFRYVTAYGGGAAAANLYAGSATDTVVGNPTQVTMTGGSFSNQAVGFAQVRAYGISGGKNKAQLTDLAIASMLQLGATSARLSNLNSRTAAFSVLLDNFCTITPLLRNPFSKLVRVADSFFASLE
jgi:hypothetical protein